jgi:hypothetical protein
MESHNQPDMKMMPGVTDGGQRRKTSALAIQFFKDSIQIHQNAAIESATRKVKPASVVSVQTFSYYPSRTLYLYQKP